MGIREVVGELHIKRKKCGQLLHCFWPL